MTTLLLAEHDNKVLKDSTSKALTAAKALGADVHVLVAGKDCKAVADAAAKLDGVKKVLLVDADVYQHNVAEPLAALIVSLAGGYDAIVAPAGKDGDRLLAGAGDASVLRADGTRDLDARGAHRRRIDALWDHVVARRVGGDVD